MRSKTFSALLCATVPALSFAHHGTRFILAEEYDMVRQPFVFFNASYLHFRGDDEIEVEPALLLPIGNDGMSEFEIHAHLGKSGGEPLTHHATGFEYRKRLTHQAGWNYAASLEYETKQPGSDESNNWTATFVAGKEDQRGMLLVNLLDNLEAERGAKQQWSYRAAYSPSPEGFVSYSFEVQGDMVKHGSHEFVVGVMQHLDLSTMLKVGIGIDLTSDSPRYSLRVGLVRGL